MWKNRLLIAIKRGLIHLCLFLQNEMWIVCEHGSRSSTLRVQLTSWTPSSAALRLFAVLLWMAEWIFLRFCRTLTNSIRCTSSRTFSSSCFSFWHGKSEVLSPHIHLKIRKARLPRDCSEKEIWICEWCANMHSMCSESALRATRNCGKYLLFILFAYLHIDFLYLDYIWMPVVLPRFWAYESDHASLSEDDTILWRRWQITQMRNDVELKSNPPQLCRIQSLCRALTLVCSTTNRDVLSAAAALNLCSCYLLCCVGSLNRSKGFSHFADEQDFFTSSCFCCRLSSTSSRGVLLCPSSSRSLCTLFLLSSTCWSSDLLLSARPLSPERERQSLC